MIQSFARPFIFNLFLFVGILSTTNTYCNWDEEVYQQTLEVAQRFECFQDMNTQYLREIEHFFAFRETFIHNHALIDEIGSLNRGEKKLFPQEACILKKRSYNNIQELFVWEMSILLSLNEFVAPSYPFKLAGHKVIVQPKKNFLSGGILHNLPSQRTKKVTLENYFRAHLLAYILAIQDLSGANIGIMNNDTLYFFDNEHSFKTLRHPQRTRLSFDLPFLSLAFDWKQYREKIGPKLASKLQKLIQVIGSRRHEILEYTQLRGLSQERTDAILKRINVLMNYTFEETTRFVDFFSYLYPKIATGMDELCKIVGRVLGQPHVGPGTALFYSVHVVKHCLPEHKHDRKALKAWIKRYISN